MKSSGISHLRVQNGVIIIGCEGIEQHFKDQIITAVLELFVPAFA